MNEDISMIYEAKEKIIPIFGEYFVKNNKDKCIIKIDNKFN